MRGCRGGAKPDGVCCVVGTLASGFAAERNTTSDLIYTDSDIYGAPDEAGRNIQYFWEAFPAGAGPTHRTTYLFSYLDAGARRALPCRVSPYASFTQSPVHPVFTDSLSAQTESPLPRTIASGIR